MQLRKPAAFDLYQSAVIDHSSLVIVSILGGRSYWEYGYQQLQIWLNGCSKLKKTSNSKNKN